jgi:hypothetical protein
MTFPEDRMPTEPPIACSLSASDLRVRLVEMTAVGTAALVDVRNDGARAELRFAARAGVRERVDAIVAAESQCCAFLALHVTETADMVVLTIQAPDGAEVVLQELVDAFSSRSQAA